MYHVGRGKRKPLFADKRIISLGFVADQFIWTTAETLVLFVPDLTIKLHENMFLIVQPQYFHIAIDTRDNN